MNDAQPARVLLKDQAYEKLKSPIIEEVFSPGTFLSEWQLAARQRSARSFLRKSV